MQALRCVLLPLLTAALCTGHTRDRRRRRGAGGRSARAASDGGSLAGGRVVALRASAARSAKGHTVACWLLCLGAWLAAAPSAAAAPRVPAGDDEVLEVLPAAARRDAPIWVEIRRLAQTLERAPLDARVAGRLAERYLRLAQESGEPRYYGYAQAVLRPWWSTDPIPGELAFARAVLRQHRHDFEGALADLDALLRRMPRHRQAWLTRAAILENLGEPAAAGASCRVFARRAPGLAGVTCLASALSLSGQHRRAYALLGSAVAARTGEPATRAWAHTILAEIAGRLENPALAEQHYQRALGLATAGGRTYLLSAYADFLLDSGRYRTVLELLEDFTAIDALALRRAVAANKLGALAPAALADLLRRLELARMRGDQPHYVDQARAALHLQDDPARALVLAQRNWQAQRGPRDARLLLEAAAAAKRPAAAGPVRRWLETTGIDDPRLRELLARLTPGAD